jgi:hypothetical protein
VEIENKSKINSSDSNVNNHEQSSLIQTSSSSNNIVTTTNCNSKEETVHHGSSKYTNDFFDSYKVVEEQTKNDTEIIDLTKKVKNLDIKNTTTHSSVVKTNETVESSSQSKNIQIEILTKNGKKELDINKYLYGDKVNSASNQLRSASILIETSPVHSIKSTNNAASTTNNNTKANFIYYYDNEHFGGY